MGYFWCAKIGNPPNSKNIDKGVVLELVYKIKSRGELKNMNTCAYWQKKMIIKLITATMDLKSKDIQEGLNMSKSVVSRHFTGEKENIDIDIFIIEQLLGVKIKEYNIVR